ncbi:uncharacterized protein LOC144653968 [Oculina patagonica]
MRAAVPVEKRGETAEVADQERLISWTVQVDVRVSVAVSVDELKDPKEDLQCQLRELEQQLTNVQGKLREKELEEVNLREQLREKTQQEENSQEQLREMERQLAIFQGQLQEKELEEVNLREQLREKTQQEENSQEQLREMERQLAIFQGQLQEKELEEVNLREQLREKTQQEENSQEQLREMERQLAIVQGQLQEKELEEVNLREQLREKTRQEENSQEQLREMERQLTIVQRQLREKELEEVNLREQLREKTQQEENSQGQLRNMELLLTNVRGQFREKEVETANLTHQVTTLEGQMRAKDLEVNELEATLSTTRQVLRKLQTSQAPDWIISRDHIQLSDKILGKGGWGIVVEGMYCGCHVAVKQIHDLILSPYNRILFEREMNIASRCRHPCLLQFIGATNDEGSPLFVTELMQLSLRALLEQRPLSEAEVTNISLDVARALSYLHQREPSPIIHRDISSANVLLWRHFDQWRGKVSDYGTAKVVQQTMTVAPGAFIYSAPEALTSNQTAKVDVYSFGVLLCEMCIQELPDPERRDEQIAMVTNSVLRALVRRCLHKEPGSRPNMERVIEELEEPRS